MCQTTTRSGRPEQVTKLDLLAIYCLILGGKAHNHVRRLTVEPEHLEANAVAPPGADHKPARPTWERAVEVIKSRRVQDRH